MTWSCFTKYSVFTFEAAVLYFLVTTNKKKKKKMTMEKIFFEYKITFLKRLTERWRYSGRNREKKKREKGNHNILLFEQFYENTRKPSSSHRIQNIIKFHRTILNKWVVFPPYFASSFLTTFLTLRLNWISLP